MSQNSGMESRFCMAWETAKPLPGSKLKSSDFCVFGSKWYLEMERVTGTDLYQINLIEVFKGHLKMPFFVTTFIEREVNSGVVDGSSENGGTVMSPVTAFLQKELKRSVTLLPSVITVESSEQRLWSYSYAKILESFPQFSDCEMFKIVCVFHGVPAPVQQCRSKTETYLRDLESLSRDLCNLLEKTSVADVKLKCGGCVISAHRAVLAARSEVFAAMFRSKMKESETGMVEVPDMDVSVLEPFLKYLYSGKIPRLTDDIVPELYSASDKYALRDLKRACSDRMVRGLTKENCLGFLTLSDAHNDRDFKASVVHFLTIHWVLYTEAWPEFGKKHPKLADEVLQTVLRKMCS